jgi:16S rRNA (cytidine1402-2'-O)-methyltransferase
MNDSGLYCVPTPIGNLRDITLRALDVLKACDAVVCEDSRVTGKLLSAYDIDKKKIIYNDHASQETRDYILSLLEEGKTLALVSDAGTPLISDPGYKLVRDCLAKGLYVTALPGANAIIPALQLSELPSDQFTFIGFLPHKSSAVQAMLKKYETHSETLIAYDTAQRIEKNLKTLLDVIGDRQVAVVREISKLYEESIRGLASEVAVRLAEKKIKGEIVLVVEGSTSQESGIDIDEMIATALIDGESIKSLSTRLAKENGLKKNDVYQRALELRDE